MNPRQDQNPQPITTNLNPPIYNSEYLPTTAPIQNPERNLVENSPTYLPNNNPNFPVSNYPYSFNPQNYYPAFAQPNYLYQYPQIPGILNPGSESINHPRFCQCNLCISKEGIIKKIKKIKKNKSGSESPSSSSSEEKIRSKEKKKDKKSHKIKESSDSESNIRYIKSKEKRKDKKKKKYMEYSSESDSHYYKHKNSESPYSSSSSDEKSNNYYHYHHNDLKMKQHHKDTSNYIFPYKYIPYAEDNANINRKYHINTKHLEKHPRYLEMERPFCKCSEENHYTYYPHQNYGTHECSKRIYPPNRHLNHNFHRSNYDRFLVTTDHPHNHFQYEEGYWPYTRDTKFTPWNEIIRSPRLNSTNRLIKQGFTRSKVCLEHLHKPEYYTSRNPHFSRYNYYHDCYPSNLYEEKMERRVFNPRSQIFHH